MRRLGALILAGALLPLTAEASRQDDPEPPPPIKVTNVTASAKVKVKSGKGGPLLVVETGKATATQSFTMTLPDKNAPKKITLRYKDVTQMPLFVLMGGNPKERTDRFLPRITNQGKQVFHFSDTGTVLPSEKGARLTFTYSPAKDHVDIEMVCHQGKSWPKGPARVAWSQRGPKKK